MGDISLVVAICTIIFSGLWIFATDEKTKDVTFLLFFVSWAINAALLLVDPKLHQEILVLNGIGIPREVMIGIAVIAITAIPIIFVVVRRNRRCR